MKRKLTVILLLVLSLLPLTATVDSFDRYPYLADEITIPHTLSENQRAWLKETSLSLVTIGPGDPLHAWFGHSALILTQPSGSQIFYDWGIFDQSQEHFYLNFAQGRMHYYIYATDGQWRINEALAEHRDVRIVELDLPDTGKFALIAYLHSFLQEGIGTYLYHFYDDNCATRIRDLIDVATGGAFAAWATEEPAGGTFRTLTASFMRHRPVTAWLLSALQGPSVDQALSRWEAMALPLELERAVHEYLGSDGGSLVAEQSVLQEVAQSGFTGRSPLAFALILSLSSFALLQILSLYLPAVKRILLGLLYLLLGVAGSILLFMMVASDMDMTYGNVNIVLLNPLLFVAAIAVLCKQSSGRSWVMTLFSLALAVLLILSLFFTQENLNTLLVLLPFYVSGATLQRRTKVKEVELSEI